MILPLAGLFADDDIKVYNELNSDDSYSIFADNNLSIPGYVRLEFTSLVNLSADSPLPFETILPPGSQRTQILHLVPGKARETHFAYTVFRAKGDPINTVPDPDYLYLFPFEHGKKFKVVQGFGGVFSHFGQNKYAIDFAMPEGTGVYAARDGLVVEVKEDSDKGGISPDYNDLANYVLIYHSDGTFGNYVHLKQNGALVRVGDRVKAGQLIAYSGNTGLSAGPHLHFDVRVQTRSGILQSIPISYLNYDGKSVVPQEGLYYYSTHPGEAAFPVVLGRLLKNEDFDSYVASAPQSDRIGLRSEQVDDTTIVYISNGGTRPFQGRVDFKLNNARSSEGNPIDIRVPARTEVFLTLLNRVQLLGAMDFTATATSN